MHADYTQIINAMSCDDHLFLSQYIRRQSHTQVGPRLNTIYPRPVIHQKRLQDMLKNIAKQHLMDEGDDVNEAEEDIKNILTI